MEGTLDVAAYPPFVPAAFPPATRGLTGLSQVVLTQAGISSMTLKRHCAETTDATSAYTETTITCADALKPAGSPRRKHSESNA
ncbi:hypothetical protein D0859_16055 [Hortaea werneckii]|uniref:Uncharacterized protein n=1 Tax=Hortaea werneckii TaxID=91943 RepID=A0A3M7I3Q0_HORWE|nr:hypothetical protein D0859_16055 [Hortaea werneckii]